MDIATLAAELSDDPLGLSYSAYSDAQVADLLNAPNRPGKRSVAASDVRMYVLLNGLWPALQAAALNPASPLIQGTAITILQTLAPNSFDQIRMNKPEIAGAVAQMLQVMVDAGVMTADQRAGLIAMGDANISRADELGLGTVYHLDVAEARNG